MLSKWMSKLLGAPSATQLAAPVKSVEEPILSESDFDNARTVLSNALQTLRDRKFKEFEKNVPHYISAFTTLSKKSPRQAISALMEIEKDRHPIKTEDFFAKASPHIAATLSRCTQTRKKDIYPIIFETAPRANLSNFILSQASDLAPLLTGDLGARLTKKILEKAAPQQKEILAAFEDKFGDLLTSLKEPLFITKQLCKAYKDISTPLPPYLEAMRASSVIEATQIIIKENASDDPSFHVIGGEIAKIMGLGLTPKDRIKAFKGPFSPDSPAGKPTNKCQRLTLFKVNCENKFDATAPEHLYVLCLGSKLSVESGKLTTLLVGHDLNDLKKAFSIMGRPSTELSALNEILNAPGLNPQKHVIDYAPKDHYKTSHYKADLQNSFNLHPAFSVVSRLTAEGNGVNSFYAQPSHQHHYWDILPIQLNSTGPLQ